MGFVSKPILYRFWNSLSQNSLPETVGLVLVQNLQIHAPLVGSLVDSLVCRLVHDSAGSLVESHQCSAEVASWSSIHSV